jgi:hypothetical protein
MITKIEIRVLRGSIVRPANHNRFVTLPDNYLDLIRIIIFSLCGSKFVEIQNLKIYSSPKQKLFR